MSNDVTETQDQGGEGWRRARERSLRLRTAPGQVPGYEVEKCLGEGAFGEVWLAKDQNNPGRRVAIKFYTHRGGDWALLAREVEKLNYLATDRYVVQLIDVGWNAEPPFYIMEYMEKGSLADRLQAGPLAVREAVELFREMAVGVINAHNRGVLHCDLKPANILLGPDSKPRLADFGQSRLSHEQAPALGTLFYMAPEQADLKAAPDAGWDVYALGAVLYCLMTGAPPYRDAPGATLLEKPAALEERLAIYRQLLQQSPQPTNHRRVPGIDRALVDIVNRCLAVNPAKRFPNVQAVLDALDARALRQARRPLLVLGAVGPVLLLLLMGLLIRTELGMAVETATDALTEETHGTNKFAAQAVAAKVAGKIDRRWRALEQEAARSSFKDLLKAAQGKALGTPEQRALQERMDKIKTDHPETSSSSWSVLDANGTLLARSPRDKRIEEKFIGQKFWHRSFFNGLAKDLDPDKARPEPPLAAFYLSNCILSTLSETRMVTFSVPVWKDKADSAADPRLGVLLMTVEVGGFVELLSEDGFSNNFLAALVDLREDADGKKGAILEHPAMADLRKQGVPQKDWKFYMDSAPLYTESCWDPAYHDPFRTQCPVYDGKWLAASQPVLIEDRPKIGAKLDIGWVVVVQERYDSAIGPVNKLESDMITRGWWALALAVSVVTGLWAFVIVVLNDGGRSRLFGFLRRRAGLKSDNPSSLKSSLSPRLDEPVAGPPAPTLTLPPQ
jgi:hypothetical protein